MIIYHQHLSSPLGSLFLGATDIGLCYLGFNEKNLYTFAHKHNAQLKATTQEFLTLTTTQIQEYFAHKRQNFDIPLDLFGTPFQQQVWQTLYTIPYGTTISYKQEAIQMGKPKSYRAVANANGRNPIVIIIPCHRVIATGGGLGGYSSGLDNKRFLLNLEHTNG
jgi:O-6-methylguanine DNA methyltransferase